MVGQCRAHHVLLDTSELLLPVGGEDVGDAASGPLLDRDVGVEQADPERLGQPAPDGGLAGARQADENRFGCHLLTGDPRGRCFAVGDAALVGGDVALGFGQRIPAEFSSAARASTNATMVSTTTPAAGTAHTSER